MRSCFFRPSGVGQAHLHRGGVELLDRHLLETRQLQGLGGLAVELLEQEAGGSSWSSGRSTGSPRSFPGRPTGSSAGFAATSGFGFGCGERLPARAGRGRRRRGRPFAPRLLAGEAASAAWPSVASPSPLGSVGPLASASGAGDSARGARSPSVSAFAPCCQGPSCRRRTARLRPSLSRLDRAGLEGGGPDGVPQLVDARLLRRAHRDEGAGPRAHRLRRGPAGGATPRRGPSCRSCSPPPRRVAGGGPATRGASRRPRSGRGARPR